MTPQEVENYIDNMYISELTNRCSFYEQVRNCMFSYNAFGALVHPLVDAITDDLENDDDYQKIGYVKARVATLLWRAYGGSLSDAGYIDALQLVLRSCRLTDGTRTLLAQRVASSTSATSATPGITMNNSASATPFVTTTINYVYGRDVKTLSEAELISAIKGVEAEIKELGKIESNSTKIALKIDELKSMLGSIVAALDASK